MAVTGEVKWLRDGEHSRRSAGSPLPTGLGHDAKRNPGPESVDPIRVPRTGAGARANLHKEQETKGRRSATEELRLLCTL